MRNLYKIIMATAFMSMVAIPVTMCVAQTPQLGKDPIQKVVQAMTLQEKAKVVVGMGWDLPPLPPGVPVPAWLKNRKIDPDAKKFPAKVQGAAGRTHPIPRLGIPIMTLSDGPAGVRINPYRNFDSTRTYFATGWPVATLLASSWDTTLVQKVGVAFGSEVHDYGIDILLAPALNIHRNPLGGRNFEYYSEDPLIAGKMASAIVKACSRMAWGHPSNTSLPITRRPVGTASIQSLVNAPCARSTLKVLRSPSKMPSHGPLCHRITK